MLMSTDDPRPPGGTPSPSGERSVGVGVGLPPKADETFDDRISASADSALAPETMPPGAHDVDMGAWLGVVIDNRYRVEELIGAGGMAAVFAAEHVRLGHRVAVKILFPAFQGHDEVRARFAREALAMARLDHPHIATAHDYGELDDGGRYMVMPLVPGQSLRDELMQREIIPWREACAIGAQVADALAGAHSAEVVHRDLKPDNVMVARREDGGVRATILDFGIARVRSLDGDDPERASRLRTLTRIGHVMGTPGYMAPEQATGAAIDARTDIYALGLVLWEMMAGHPRFDGDNVSEILEEQLVEGTPPLRAVAGQEDLPPRLDELIATMLEAKAPQRPATAAEVRDRLLALAYASVDVEAETLPPRRDDDPTVAVPHAFPTVPPKKRGAAWMFMMLAGALCVAAGGYAAGRFLPTPGTRATEVPAELEEQVETLLNGARPADRGAAARSLLAYEPVENVPEWVEAAAQLTAARSCETRSEGIARIVAIGDRRARPALDHIDRAPRRGCGRNNRFDCYSCNREELAEAMQALLEDDVSEPVEADNGAAEADATDATDTDAGADGAPATTP